MKKTLSILVFLFSSIVILAQSVEYQTFIYTNDDLANEIQSLCEERNSTRSYMGDLFNASKESVKGIASGYTWSEAQKDCIRLWEKGVRMNAVDDAEKMLFLVFSPDSTQVELFFSEEEMPNEILERRGLPAGGYVWNVEDDDTKNVRLEDGRWTVSQRGRLIYWQAEEAAGN